MARLILKVDVDTFRGTDEGVPRLIETFQKAGIAATFLFSLGPDHTGRAIKRIFRPGFFAKVQRTSVVEHYGIRTLLYGTLLPGPDIGRRCAPILRATREAGHEVGIHTWDHILWQDQVRFQNEAWTQTIMQRAFDRFLEIFGHIPQTHGAAGWQMNGYALRQLDRWGLHYASDGRAGGTEAGPYRPVVDGVPTSCIQIPTTLPTLDELIGIDGRDAAGAVAALLDMTAGTPRDHVFTLHTELEGARLLEPFQNLLRGWRTQGYTFSTLSGYYHSLAVDTLPRREFAWGSVPGRTGELMIAGSVR